MEIWEPKPPENLWATPGLLQDSFTFIIIIIIIIVVVVVIQLLGWSGQRPELRQATGMALVRCILGKFLGVACHYFPPPLFFMFPLYLYPYIIILHLKELHTWKIQSEM